MNLFNNKNKSTLGDHLLAISNSVSRTEMNIENLKEGFNEHVKAGYEQRKLDKQLLKNIEDKIDLCPEKERIDKIEKKQIQDIGKATAWKIVALVISAITGTVIVLVNIFKWKPWN